jgi:hypothetical protein
LAFRGIILRVPCASGLTGLDLVLLPFLELICFAFVCFALLGGVFRDGALVLDMLRTTFGIRMAGGCLAFLGGVFGVGGFVGGDV